MIGDYILLLDIGLVIICALIGAAIFQRFKMPPVVGMVLAGIILSPFTPGYYVDAQDISFFSQIGAILLMFVIGLQFDYRTFGSQSKWGFMLAGFGCIVTFIVGTVVGLFLGWSYEYSLLLGALFVPTSTTISLRLLEEMNVGHSKLSDALKASIIIDDFYGFIAFALISSQLGISSVAGTELLSSAFYMILYTVLIFLIGIVVTPKIFNMAEKVFPHSALSLGTAFCLIISYTVVVFNLSPIIGAFLAGTILTSSFAHRQVLESVEPMKNLFGSIFFASIGLSIDPLSIIPVLPMALLLSAIAFISKAIPASAFMFWRGETLLKSLVLGSATGPRGEVLLIIAQTAVASQLVGADFLSLATSIVVFTAISTPLVMKTIMANVKSTHKKR